MAKSVTRLRGRTGRLAEGDAASKTLNGHSKRKMIRLDANEPTFGRDLEDAFKKNVARARRENKRLLGVRDFLPGHR
jgi:hypothetical protein